MAATALTALATIDGCGWRPAYRTPVSADREPGGVQDVVTYNIQVGLFDSQDEADNIADAARGLVTDTVLVVYKAPFYRVWIKAGLPENEADELTGHLRREGFTDARRIFEEEEY